MRLSLFTVLLWALGAASCARPPAHVRYAHAHAQAHTYQVPLDEVWPYALQLLVERGFELETNDALEEGARYSAETSWQASGQTRVRYIAHGKNYSDRTSQVSFTRQTRYLGQTEVALERAPDLEWELLRLVDPEAAAEIEASAPSDEE